MKKAPKSPETRTRVFVVLEVVHVSSREAARVDLLVSSARSDEVLRHSWPLQNGVLWDSQLQDLLAEIGKHVIAQTIDFVGVQTALEV